MFYISFSLHILPTFIERGGSFLVSNSYSELVGWVCWHTLLYIGKYLKLHKILIIFLIGCKNKHFLGNHQTFF